MYSKIAGKVQELMHGAKSLRVSCTGTGVGMVGHLEKGHLNPQSCIDVFDFLSSKNEWFFWFFLVKYGLILRWDFVWIPIDFKINLINIIYWFQDLIKQRLKRLIVINIRCSGILFNDVWWTSMCYRIWRVNLNSDRRAHLLMLTEWILVASLFVWANMNKLAI